MMLHIECPVARPGGDDAGMTRIVFVGAGSVVFTRQLLHDLFRVPELAGLDIALHDIDAERLDTAERAARQIAARTSAGASIGAHAELDAALDGADFVVNMIAVGGHRATETDFAIPAEYGLRQTIGDTLGVGGIFRALRTFPVLSRIAESMERCAAPGALLMNYTNPMAMNIWWLAQRHPATRAVGLCHSVWTVNDLCELLGIPVEEVDYRAAGVNHQAWLVQWRHRGEDLYPRLRELIAADAQLRRRVRVDMFRRLGFYPTETSEHSAEYVPWYLHHDSEIERLRIPVGDYLQISAANVRDYEHTRCLLLRGEDLELHDEVAEYAPQIVRAMVLGEPTQIHANVPNHGLIANLLAARDRGGAHDRRLPRTSSAGDGGVAAPVRGAQPDLPQRWGADRAGGARGGSDARAPGDDARPQHRGDLDPRAGLRPRRRHGRRARRPGARVVAEGVRSRRRGRAEPRHRPRRRALSR